MAGALALFRAACGVQMATVALIALGAVNYFR
jgi:hypothetical protein